MSRPNVTPGPEPLEHSDDDLLTVHEVARILNLAVGSIYHLVSQGRIPHVHLSSRCLRFRRDSIRVWINSLSDAGK